MQSSLRDWKDRNYRGKWSKASIFLATMIGKSSFQVASIEPSTHSPGMTLQPNGIVVENDNSAHTADVRHPTSQDIARLTFSSPWPFILIELLSGETIGEDQSWVYPFKHLVLYEKQIRKFVELLNETQMDGVEPKDLPHSLSRIVGEVVRILGPKREEVEYSDSYVSYILQKRTALKNHYVKVKLSSPEDQEELEDNDKAEHDLSSTSPIDEPSIMVSARTNQAPKENLVPEESLYVCTCLKDARDHLELLVNTIDSQLSSLLILHKAIRDREISKIKFGYLWHLFQPGDVVVTSRKPCQAYRVIHVSGGRPLLTTTDVFGRDNAADSRPTLPRQSQVSPFSIDCVRFDFDGEKFGPVQDKICIQEYEEERIITKLDVYPIYYAERGENLSKTLIDRGRRFAEYSSFQHKRYQGLSLSEPQEEVSTAGRLSM